MTMGMAAAINDTISTDLGQAISIVGCLLYICTYLSLTFRIVNSDQPAYFMVQALASFCVLIGLASAFNLAAAVTQAFILVISVCGIAIRLWPVVRPAGRRAGPLGPDPRPAGAFAETEYLDRARN